MRGNRINDEERCEVLETENIRLSAQLAPMREALAETIADVESLVSAIRDALRYPALAERTLTTAIDVHGDTSGARAALGEAP